MLKKQQLKIAIRILIGIGVLTVFSVVANIVLLNQNKNLALEQARLEENFDQKIIALGQEQIGLARQINFIAGVSDASLEDIALLRNETTEQLDEVQTLGQIALDDVQASLRDELVENIQSNNSRISSIIDDWDNVVGLVSCDSSRGSGVLFNLNGIVSLVTNQHVIADSEDVIAETCSVTFPLGQADDFNFKSNDVTVEMIKDDLAIITVPSLTEITKSEAKSNTTWCSAKPNIGEQVVILGYPAIGAKESLTATEGIISGYDNDYFISSAKVDQGNSGGAAIWVENNCYLGIPTKVFAGKAETLARVLDIQALGL